MPILRSGGILLHITSLPGPYGTGTFGAPALSFAHRLAGAGIRYWQVLPLGRPEAEDSPYQCLSAFAGNPVLIDPDRLAETGLVSPDEAEACRCSGDPGMAEFSEAAVKRETLLRLAFDRLGEPEKAQVRAFVDAQRDWVVDYAWFLTIRGYFDGLPWWEWPDEGLRRRDRAALEDFVRQHGDEVFFHMYVQYEFSRQWNALKSGANAAGVRFIGDMPIYVARDSADVWSHTDLFEMDECLAPIRVAGVPPDYFSEDGQLWGNPIYDWTVAARDGYGWWLSRIAFSLRQFDAVRIDHFRGFEAFWAVDADQDTARDGVWVDGPGMDLFRRVSDRYEDAEIIAEDLGLLTDRTRAFLLETGYPGMRVMQFAFDGSPDNPHLPYNYPRNCVAYVGTHDNSTLAGWLADVPLDNARRALRYCRADSAEPAAVCRAWIQTLWSSAADLAVATVQDLLALDDTRRMNVPGVAEGNWTFRLTGGEMEAIDFTWLHEIGDLYGRVPH